MSVRTRVCVRGQTGQDGMRNTVKGKREGCGEIFFGESHERGVVGRHYMHVHICVWSHGGGREQEGGWGKWEGWYKKRKCVVGGGGGLTCVVGRGKAETITCCGVLLGEGGKEVQREHKN